MCTYQITVALKSGIVLTPSTGRTMYKRYFATGNTFAEAEAMYLDERRYFADGECYEIESITILGTAKLIESKARMGEID